MSSGEFNESVKLSKSSGSRQPIEIILNDETVKLIAKANEKSDIKSGFWKYISNIDTISKIIISIAVLFFSYTTTCSTIIEKTKPIFYNLDVTTFSKNEEQDIEILKTYMPTPIFYFTYGACYFCDIRTMIRMYFNREPKEKQNTSDRSTGVITTSTKHAGFFPITSSNRLLATEGFAASPPTDGSAILLATLSKRAASISNEPNKIIPVSNGDCGTSFKNSGSGWIAAGIEDEVSETISYAETALNPFKLTEQTLNDQSLRANVFTIRKAVNLRPNAADWSKTLQVMNVGTNVCITTSKMLKFIGNQRQVWVEIKFETP